MEERGYEAAKLAHANRTAFTGFANQTATEMSSQAIKAMMLINGGAAVAMLGFVANVSGGEAAAQLNLSAIVAALVWFALGSGLSVLAAGLSYVVMYLQAVHSEHGSRTYEHPYFEHGKGAGWVHGVMVFFHISAFLAASASLAAFAWGVSDVAEIVLTPVAG